MAQRAGRGGVLGALRCAALVVVAGVAHPACALKDGKVQVVTQEPIVTDPTQWPSPPCRGGELCAGAAEVDITPPPGLPTYGYSTNGACEASGYWLRLRARILVFEQTTPAVGEAPARVTRVAMIQADLGASSALVHRKLASALHEQGIGPASLLLATTHTHGGPGGFFGDKFYNRSVGARPAFIPEYVDQLVGSMKRGVDLALADLRPARIGVATAEVDASAAHNRSYDAWQANFVGLSMPPKSTTAIDRTLRLLRVDTLDGGEFRPRALWSVFAVHGTAMPPGFPLYHGDVHGLAARLAQRRVEELAGVSGFVAAMANGAEGDVGPGTGTDTRGKALTMAVAGHQASAAVTAFRSLDEQMRRGDGPKTIDFAYEEVSLRGASTALGPVCEVAMLGAPQAAGSEDSRGPLYGSLGMIEGETHDPFGCQASKNKIGEGFQDLLFKPSEFPDVVPFQVVAFGNRDDSRGLFLAAFPGEPTTEVGRLVRKKIGSRYPGTVAVVGLANGYATYFTTPKEFLAQHYEGGSTIYGPLQGVFAAEQLDRVSRWVGADEKVRPATRAYRTTRSFQPGASKGIYPEKPSCDVQSWKPIGLRRTSLPLAGTKTEAAVTTFRWSGMKADEACDLATVDIECGPGAGGDARRPFMDHRGFPATDVGFDFEVWREGDSTWNAAWTERPGTAGTSCMFVVRQGGAKRVVSDTFPLPGVGG